MKKYILIILVCITTITFAQVKTLTNVRPAAPANQLGWDGSGANTGDLQIRNDFANQPISFLLGTLKIQYMTLTSTGLGVGNTFGATTILDIKPPALNLAYGINGLNVLQNWGTRNIYTGVGTGFNLNGGVDNTSNGYNAGYSGTSGSQNTFVGHVAGYTGQTFIKNTYVGDSAGYFSTQDSDVFVGASCGLHNTTGKHNVAMGFQSLYHCQDAHNNTAVGFAALHELVTGVGSPVESENTAVGDSALFYNIAYGGCALGYNAGLHNTHGCSLIAIGEEAAKNSQDGNDNTAIGEAALRDNKYLSNNVAIGFIAMQTMNYNPSYTCSSPAFGCVTSNNVAVGNSALFHTNPTSSTNDILNNGMNNTAIGISAGDGNTTGYDNVFLGYRALFSNTTGADNAAGGSQACYFNQTGTFNAVFGYQAGYGVVSSSHSYNSIFGAQAGFGITTGQFNVFNGTYAGYTTSSSSGNVFSGYQSGYSNTTNYNTCLGYRAGYTTSSGPRNAFVGYFAGFNNTTGTDNAAIGPNTGLTNTTGTRNTFLGPNADAGGAGLTDATAVGNSAVVPNSHEVWIGSTTVTVFSGTVAYTGSDGRFKNNVTENVKGLEFINKLRPVTYTLDTKKFDDMLTQNMADTVRQLRGNIDFAPSSAIIHSGFIAQEVEQAGIDCGFTSSIVHTPANNTDPYALAYAEIVVPLVKAVQQLDSANKALAAQVSSLQNQMIGSGSMQRKSDGTEINTQQVSLSSDNQDVVLYQNEPNPFGISTTIRYFIPDNVKNVQVVFYNQIGKEIKRVPINQSGNGQLEISSENLPSAIYTYSISVDGRVLDTKKMVKN